MYPAWQQCCGTAWADHRGWSGRLYFRLMFGGKLTADFVEQVVDVVRRAFAL